MKKNYLKKVLISLIAILLMVSVAYTIYATDGNVDVNDIMQMLQQENGNISNNEKADEIPEGINNNASLNVNTNTNTNTNVNKNNVNENLPETTPHAGVEGYTGLIFVAIFGVSAIYAYKKVKEYNA